MSSEKASNKMFQCNRLSRAIYCFPSEFHSCALRESTFVTLTSFRKGVEKKKRKRKHENISNKSNRLSLCDNAWTPDCRLVIFDLEIIENQHDRSWEHSDFTLFSKVAWVHINLSLFITTPRVCFRHLHVHNKHLSKCLNGFTNPIGEVSNYINIWH